MATKMFVVLTLLLVASVSAQSPPGDRATRWREDLVFLAEELEARHAELYHTISRDEFRDGMATLANRLERLSDNEIIIELARVTTRIGDGHTGLFLPWARGLEYRKLPIELYAASDGWLVLATSPQYSALAGSQLVKIGATPAGEVVRSLMPLMPRDNEYTPRPTSHLLMIPEVLAALGFIASADAIPMTLEDKAGTRQEVVVRPVARTAAIDWQYDRPKERLAMWLRRREEKYWFEYLPATKTVYVQFNSADIGSGAPEKEFAAFADTLVRTVEQNDVERLIVDLRWNAGGSFVRTRHLLRALIRSEKLNQTGRLFTIIGPGTFSAATALATEIDWHTQSLFVGGPTGGRPNAFGDIGRLILPNSRIEVRYSRYKMQQSLSEDRRPAIFPDLKAELSIADYRSGVDPAMEVIARYRERRLLREVLRPVVETKGTSEAIEVYRRLRDDQYNEIEFGHAELDSIGAELLRAGRVSDAIALFRVNVDEYPWWAWGWSSLGEAYLQLGDRARAMDAFRQAFELDKRVTKYRDLLREPQKTP